MNTSKPSKHARVISKSDEDLATMREALLKGDIATRESLLSACQIASTFEDSKHYPLYLIGFAARAVLVPIVSESLERNGKDGAK